MQSTVLIFLSSSFMIPWESRLIHDNQVMKCIGNLVCFQCGLLPFFPRCVHMLEDSDLPWSTGAASVC